MKSAIALLYEKPNDMWTEKLNKLSFESILKNSKNVTVYLGTSSPTSVPGYMKEFPNLEIVDLRDSAISLNVKSTLEVSSTWGDVNFNRMMLLKFELIAKVSTNADFITYSDLDIVWRGDVLLALESLIKRNKNADLFFQDQTFQIDAPRLCAGFFAFRNSDTSRNFFESAFAQQQIKLSELGNYDDQEAMIDIMLSEDFTDSCYLLPQTIFPTGYLMPLYRKSSYFPALKRPNPLIFHSNFVVGGKRKLALLKKASMIQDSLGLRFFFFSNLVLPFQQNIRILKNEFNVRFR
jgi:hypothetical protein